MNDQIRYLPEVEWRTIIRSVELFAVETDETPAIYLAKVKPLNINDPGALTAIEVGFYIKDLAGKTYRITEINVNGNPQQVKLSDIFRSGLSPEILRPAIIYKSFGDGVPSFLYPTKENSLLWRNINFANVRWHVTGFVFEYVLADEKVTYTAGEIFLHYWDYSKETNRATEDLTTDLNPVHRSWTIALGEYSFPDTDAYYAYIKLPLDSEVTTATVIFSKEYFHERIFDDYILVLSGVCNAQTDGQRSLALLWGNTKEIQQPIKHGIETATLVWLYGLTYAMTVTYYFFGKYFEVNTIVTHDTADATNDRVDVYYVDNAGLGNILAGTAAADPTKPIIDHLTQLEVTFVTIAAAATEPTGITDELIYNENVEWTGSSEGVTVNFDDTTDPFVGSKDANVGTLTYADKVNFTGLTDIATTDFKTIIFGIKLKEPINTGRLNLVFTSGASRASENYIFRINYDSLEWQYVIIDLSRIDWRTATFDGVSFLYLSSVGHSGFYLDFVKLQTGLEQPETINTIELIGDVTGKGFTGKPIETTLKNVGTAGTYGGATKTLTVITDAKGRVTSVTENDIEAGGGSDIVAGDGMDFETNDPVTLGLPSTIDSTTENAVTETSHTHELGTISIDNISAGSNIKYGALYNWFVTIDSRKITNSDDWIVPLGDSGSPAYNGQVGILIKYLDPSLTTYYSVIAGTKIKENINEYWDDTSLGDNSSFFNGRGSGIRTSAGFSKIKDELRFWSAGSSWQTADDKPVSVLTGSSADFRVPIWGKGSVVNKKYDGVSIRLVRPANETELLLPDGLISATYTGNDGKVYSCTKIGTQIWIASNLNETKYRNGDWITGFDGGVYTPIADAAWAALTTEAMCYYDDNEAYGGGQTPLTSLLHPPVTIHPDSASRGSIDENQVLTINAQTSQITGLTLEVANWVADGSLYKYVLSHASITATASVEVIPANASYDVLVDAEPLPETESAAGSVTVWAKAIPSADVPVTINITEVI